MKKKILSGQFSTITMCKLRSVALILITVIAFCLFNTAPVFAEQIEGFSNDSARVQDSAELLTESEESELSAKLDEIRSRQNADIVIVTTNTLNGQTARDYADDYYDYNGFGYGENRDGVLLLISMEDNDWYISTMGFCITAFTDAGIEYIGEQMQEDLSNGNFSGAFNTYAELSDDFLTQAKSDEPYDIDSLPKEPLSLIWIPISIAVGIVLSLIIVGKMKSELKTVRSQAAANNYIKNGSLNITDSRDVFLYNNVTRTAKPKDNSSGGGSSTHTSSSGTTHGGGGGKF